MQRTVSSVLARSALFALSLVTLASFEALAQTSVTVLNNEQWIDGITITNPQQFYSNTAYNWGNTGGLIHWINNRGTSAAVSGNAFGNTAAPLAPGVTFLGTCGPNTVPNGTYITAQIIPFDGIGDIGTLSPAATAENTTGSPACLQITFPLADSNFPGLAGYEILACGSTTLPCTSVFSLQAEDGVPKPTAYGPFPASTSVITFDWSASGPALLPPANSAGLVVPNTIIDFGTGPFLISVPQVPGTASAIAGYKRNVSTIQLSPSFPNGIPQLPEPWGQLCAPSSTCGSGGTLTYAATVDDVLYEYSYASSSTVPVQVSEPHTFPAFVSGYTAVEVNNPGVPLASGIWQPSTYYWVGERVAVEVGTTNTWLILTATVAGTSAQNEPSWQTASPGICSSNSPGGTCNPDGGVTWTILSFINTYASGSCTYSQGSEIYAPASKTFWESQQAIPSTCGLITFPTFAPIGLVVSDGTYNWINIGLNTLVSPQFQFWAQQCMVTAGEYSKQCAGNGMSSQPYLSQLKQVASLSANWSGCNQSAQCTQGSSTLLPQFTSINPPFSSGTFPGAPTLSFPSCPTWFSCNLGTSQMYVQTAWFTPSGGASPLAEATMMATSMRALQINPPSNPPPNAVGWMPFVSFTSGNGLLQRPNGVQGYCSAYVANLPYGQLCTLTATFTATSLTPIKGTTPQRPTAANASEIAVGLGGLPITGPWAGGAYGTDINDISIECSKQNVIPSVVEPYSWGVFNMSAQEGSNQNGTAHGMLQTSDCAGGGYYLFSPAAEDAGAGTFHVNTGQVADYTYGVRVEDVSALRSVMDVSIGPVQNSQYATRAGVQLKVNLVSSIPVDSGYGLPQCGEVVGMHGEDTIEQIDVSNCAFHTANIYGRTGGSGRSPFYGLHIEPFTADYNANQIVALGNNCNIQDDTISPISCLSTEASTDTTSGFFAAGDVLGSSSPNETLLTTDPGVPSQFYDGATFGTSKQFALSNAGVVTAGTWNGTAVGVGYGGTGINTSASSGVPQVSSGAWSVSTTLPSGLSATNMTLVTPALGTPTSATLTNATGLPLSSVTASTVATTINNNNNEETWQCTLTGTTPCFNLTENSHSTGTGALLSVSNIASSSAVAALINGATTATSDILDVDLNSAKEFYVNSVGVVNVNSTLQLAATMSATAATTSITVQGGQDVGTTSTVGGSLMLRGATNTKTADSSVAAGSAVLGPGLLTGAAPTGTLGIYQTYAQVFKGTAIANVGDVVAWTSAALTVTDCSHTAQQCNIAGISTSTSSPYVIVTAGFAFVKTAVAATLGDSLCMGSATDGLAVDLGSGARRRNRTVSPTTPPPGARTSPPGCDSRVSAGDRFASSLAFSPF
jgi:hypothetical protein